MTQSNDDALHELHEEYLRQISESDMPIWLLDIYGSSSSKRENARPLYSYRLFWLDEHYTEHFQVACAYTMYEAMAYIENQAMQFGYKQCRFTKVELYDDDPDHPLPQDTWDGDLPF